MGLLYGENCKILTSTVFDRSTRATDERTNGRWHTRYSIYITLSRVLGLAYKARSKGEEREEKRDHDD